MRAVIFANGVLNYAPRLEAGDLIIAADGGGRHCLALGLQPELVVGDLDSLTPGELAALELGGARVERYPQRKDFTDLELALGYARRAGVDEILILGALGMRWDQTLANLLLAASQPDLRLGLEDGAERFYFIRGGETLELSGQAGELVSLIPLAGMVCGVVTHGLEYPLQAENLDFGTTRGVSNRMLAERASVTVEAGLLLCIHTRREAADR